MKSLSLLTSSSCYCWSSFFLQKQDLPFFRCSCGSRGLRWPKLQASYSCCLQGDSCEPFSFNFRGLFSEYLQLFFQNLVLVTRQTGTCPWISSLRFINSFEACSSPGLCLALKQFCCSSLPSLRLFLWLEEELCLLPFRMIIRINNKKNHSNSLPSRHSQTLASVAIFCCSNYLIADQNSMRNRVRGEGSCCLGCGREGMCLGFAPKQSFGIMSGKNEGVQTSTLPSPSPDIYPCSNEDGRDCLAYKSSISSGSRAEKQQIDTHVTSYSSDERIAPRSRQHTSICVLVGAQRYELDDSSPARLQTQLQKIFSVCRLNEQTRTALQMVILHRIAEANPLFRPLLLDSYARYTRRGLTAVEQCCPK